MASHRHIIASQVLEVQTARRADVTTFQNRLRELYYQDLLPRIEAMFDRYTPADEVIRMDRMTVEVLVSGRGDWEAELIEATLQQLESTLQGSPAAWKNGSMSPHDDAYDAVGSLAFFLAHGTMPWYASGKNLAQVESEALGISPAGALGTQLRPLIFSDAAARERAVFQLSDAMLTALFGGPAFQFLKAWTLRYGAPPDVERPRVIFWKAVVDAESRHPSSAWLAGSWALGSYARQHTEEERERLYANLPDRVRTRLQAALSATPGDPTAAAEEKAPPQRNGEGVHPAHIFIENAGLVILHPFLEPFFERIGLWRAPRFVSAAAQRRAVLLTQYMVSPEDKIQEYTLSLNKLLCGYPGEQTLENRIIVTAEEKTEITDLLQTVTGQWKMRGVAVCTTEQHLREAFLQRPGKLSRDARGWALQVEVKSYDVVMNGLPWGISRIFCPWMEGMLRVEWS